MVEKVLTTAKEEIGYLEKKDNKDLQDKTKNAGQNNYTKYWEEFAPNWQGQPWCMRFVRWCLYKNDLVKLLPNTESCTTAMNWAKKNNQWFTNPHIGDVVIFGTKDLGEHTGFVSEIKGYSIYTVEGNTSRGVKVIPNGGSVCSKDYLLNNPKILGYIRPNYPKGDYLSNMTKTEFEAALETVKPVTYATTADIPSWGKEAIDKAIEVGAINGTGKDESGNIILNISNDLLRTIVILNRVGVFS